MLIRPRSSHVIGDLLHRLDFHSDVKGTVKLTGVQAGC